MRIDQVVMSKVSIFGMESLFTTLRVPGNQLPEGCYRYEVEYSDEDGFVAVRIGNEILSNYYGAVITKEPIVMNKDGFRSLEKGDLFSLTGSSSLKEFRKEGKVME